MTPGMATDLSDSFPLPLSIPIGFLIELSETHNKDEVLAAFARWVKLVLDCGRISILVPGSGGALERILIENSQMVTTGETTALYGTTLGMLFRERRSAIYPDLAELDTPDARHVADRGLKAGVVAPISFGSKCLGILVATYFDSKDTLDEDLLLLESMGRCLASYMLLHEQLTEMSQIAVTDPLTKAKNRRFFNQVTSQAMARWRDEGEPFALMICDLDHFKSLNDTFGHDFGDEVLCGVADAMREVARPSDHVVRLGGEEFCLFMPSTGIGKAKQCAEAVRLQIESRHFAFADEVVPVTTSIGVSAISPETRSVRRLTIAADEALYRAKASGRNRVAVAR